MRVVEGVSGLVLPLVAGTLDIIAVLCLVPLVTLGLHIVVVVKSATAAVVAAVVVAAAVVAAVVVAAVVVVVAVVIVAALVAATKDYVSFLLYMGFNVIYCHNMKDYQSNIDMCIDFCCFCDNKHYARK